MGGFVHLTPSGELWPALGRGRPPSWCRGGTPFDIRAALWGKVRGPCFFVASVDPFTIYIYIYTQYIFIKQHKPDNYPDKPNQSLLLHMIQSCD